MTYFIIGILLLTGFIFCLTSCRNKSTANDKQTTPNETTTNHKVHQTKENSFEGLRNMAL